MTWILRRLRAIFRQDAYPWERRWLIYGRTLQLLLSGGLSAGMVVWWDARLWPLVIDLPPWITGPWWAFSTIGAAPAVFFVWADFRLEEWWREIGFGASVVPGIAPTKTYESFTGFARGHYAEDDALERLWNSEKFRPLSPTQGDPGSGRFDVLQPGEVTWAVRLHHRYVRPWARRRGWVTG